MSKRFVDEKSSSHNGENINDPKNNFGKVIKIMKRTLVFSILLLMWAVQLSYAGDNTFPPSGNVGIGTTRPMSNLDVKHRINVTNAENVSIFGLKGTRFGYSSAYKVLQVGSGHVGNEANVAIGVDLSGNPSGSFHGDGRTVYFRNGISFGTPNSTNNGFHYPIILKDGKVGINTGYNSTPQSDLAVNGTITAKEIVVTETGWADFVFENDYTLTPLNKVERHIKENKHLPGIPSAGEVAENGVSVGEMQAKLLQKVEELTLYVIELKKENDQLKARVSSLENANN